MAGIRISEKYGANPSLDTCFICGKETSVILFGTAYKDENGKTAEAPSRVCTGQVCEDCQKVMDKGGIFFIAVKDGETGDNPCRTGQITAIKEEAAARIFPHFPYRRINYIEESAFNQIFKTED